MAKPHPEQPIAQPPISRPPTVRPPHTGRPPAYRPPVVVLPPNYWHGTYPAYRWHSSGEDYWIYTQPDQPSPMPDEWVNLRFLADDRAELLIVDANQQVVFEGWLGMGDQRQWSVTPPVRVQVSQLQDIYIFVDGKALDLNEYPQLAPVSLTFGQEKRPDSGD